MFPFTLNQLRILKSIATEKSFTKAAKALYLSQPSLSKQIRILEKNLGLLLVNREKKQILLTENGELLVQYSERILALCEESCRALMDLKTGERGNLIIGSDRTLGTYLFPKILSLFAQAHPKMNLNLQVHSARTLQNQVRFNEIDIGILLENTESSFIKSPGVNMVPFMKDPLMLVASEIHPFAKRKNIQKKELYSLDYVMLTNSCNQKQQIEKALEQNKINTAQMKCISKLESIESIKIAVGLGLGVAFLPMFSVEKEVEAGTLKFISIDEVQINQTLCFINNFDCKKPQALQQFYYEIKKLGH